MSIDTETKNNIERPPANTLRVTAWRDLPSHRAPAKYEIILGDGSVKTITLAKGNRIILDALLKSPVYCASPVRISDRVCVLRHEYGVPITKEMFDGDIATDRTKFGVYFIGAGVRRIGGGAA